MNLPRVGLFGACITRGCTIKAVERGALNLSQGFPEEEPLGAIKEVAIRAIQDGPNQYADMRGAPSLRKALASRYAESPGMEWVDADKNVSVTCGATEAMAAALLATAGPGDEVVIQEPTYENYPPQALIAGATIKYLRSQGPDWRITRKALEEAFSSRTRVLVLNGPNNPTGRVYSAEEMAIIRELVLRYQTIVLVDEIYEHLTWDGRRHIHFATLPGMRDRTVTISGASKAFAVTGWRVGWAIAPEEITLALRRIHDFLTATVPTPLQTAIVAALALPDSYYCQLKASYERRRALLAGYLQEAKLTFSMAEGAYYFFPSCASLAFRDSEEFAEALLVEAGVAVVPYTAFYRTKGIGADRFRINFAKREETLTEAGRRIVEFCRKHRRA